MSEYHASVLVDGWIRLRVHAGNRADAMRQLKMANVKFALVDGSMNVIGEVVHETGEHPDSMFMLDIEEVDLHNADEFSRYHLPIKPPPDLR